MGFRRAVIVLGAGASKGARLVGRRTPPLDVEFLGTAAAYFAGKRARGTGRAQVKVWNDFKKHLASAGLTFSEIRTWRLEQLSTFLEARASLRGMQLRRGRPNDYAKALECLKVIVCHVLRVEGGTRSCELHKMLFELISPQAILSFNYDLIADQSLAELGLLDWRASQYRCARFAASVNDEGTTAYVPIYPTRHDGSVPLLKLHGSMHYEKLLRGEGYRLCGVSLPSTDRDGFRYIEVPKHPYIVPPVAAKIDIRQLALRERWYSALDYLHEAPSWIIWGYSFPTTDTISQVLFRTALTNNRKPKPVLVVNPDAAVAARVREVCRKVMVEQYPSIERLLLDENRIGRIE